MSGNHRNQTPLAVLTTWPGVIVTGAIVFVVLVLICPAGGLAALATTGLMVYGAWADDRDTRR